MPVDVDRWSYPGGRAVAVVGSPTDLRTFAAALRSGEGGGVVEVVVSEAMHLDVEDDGLAVVLTGGMGVLDLLATVVENVAEAAQRADLGEVRHADLDCTNIDWLSPTSLPLEIVGRRD